MVLRTEYISSPTGIWEAAPRPGTNGREAAAAMAVRVNSRRLRRQQVAFFMADIVARWRSVRKWKWWATAGGPRATLSEGLKTQSRETSEAAPEEAHLLGQLAFARAGRVSFLCAG